MRITGSFMAFAAVLSIILSCNQSQPSKEILTPAVLSQLDSAEKAMFASTFNGDSAAFHKLCDTDYFTINATGTSQDLEAALKTIGFFKGSSGELSEQKQRVFGDMVLRTGRAKFSFGGKPAAEILYTGGWVYRDGRWQFVHWQGTFTGMSVAPSAPTMPEPGK